MLYVLNTLLISVPLNGVFHHLGHSSSISRYWKILFLPQPHFPPSPIWRKRKAERINRGNVWKHCLQLWDLPIEIQITMYLTMVFHFSLFSHQPIEFWDLPRFIHLLSWPYNLSELPLPTFPCAVQTLIAQPARSPSLKLLRNTLRWLKQRSWDTDITTTLILYMKSLKAKTVEQLVYGQSTR